VLVSPVLGAINQFDKVSLVAKLKAARDRKKAVTGKCGGPRSYVEARPDVVALAKQLHSRAACRCERYPPSCKFEAM
jgi:hypothetical protein